MGQRIETNPELWYPFVVEIGECIIAAKVPVAPDFISRKPPERFVPSLGEKFDEIAIFGYGDEAETYLIRFGLVKYSHADQPFSNFAAFASHLEKKFGELWVQNNFQPTLYETDRWVNLYSPPWQKSPNVVISATDSYYYPMTSEYALFVGGNYSGKFAENAKRHASLRAITRKVLANVQISGCGYYAHEDAPHGSNVSPP